MPNGPTLRADINQREGGQRLATRLVRGFRHVPYEKGFDNSVSSRWNEDASFYVAKVVYLAVTGARHQREAGLFVPPQSAGQ